MWNTVTRCLVLSLILSGCAHRGAMRVDCEGPLRPINQPTLKGPPVTVVPASPETPTSGER